MITIMIITIPMLLSNMLTITASVGLWLQDWGNQDQRTAEKS
jgi:multisubunit Na+/H+ antiporter MnhG subunit